MSISSLGRSLATPGLREPVAPLSSSEASAKQAKSSSTVTDLPANNTVAEAEKVSMQPFEATSQIKSIDVVDEIQQFQDLMRRNSIKFNTSGPLSSPELTIVDHVNNIDFEREIPPEAFKERIFELRESFTQSLATDNISFDVSAPLSRMVLVIKESINETEFIRQLPKSLNDERVQKLIAFATEQGFDFEAVA